MASRLVNVRLDEERRRKVRALRETGVALSDLVRDTIDARFEEIRARRVRRDVAAVVKRVFDQYPDPPGLRRRTYDVHDSGEAREAILRKLPRRRR
ncbi:MAG: hypothetical protein HYS05_19915 [Acidobacteria bacterium]|nr:hypothetical protein [Acidobacteriota bacterium]